MGEGKDTPMLDAAIHMGGKVTKVDGRELRDGGTLPDGVGGVLTNTPDGKQTIHISADEIAKLPGSVEEQ